jgi:myo-inositol-1(or 4)-monophosphatase
MAELDGVLELALRLAREAGAIQKSRYETGFEIATKGRPVDLVTEVDHACEAHVVVALLRERPDDAVLAEEGRGIDRPGARLRWVIDPLDGTTNFAHGYPRFAVSIGVERDSEPAVGVVYDPLLDECYHAVAGGGAFRNGQPIRVSRETEWGRALLATGFAYDKRETEDDNLAEFRAVLKTAREVRRDGSASLDLCYVACGRLDGYWEHKLKPWDVAAGALVVREAGGRVSDRSGGGAWRSGSEIVATNGGVHDALLRLLAGARRG